MALPSGVVTFVFSDIEGSTRLWEADPGRMRACLAHHDELVRNVVESAQGTVFKHTGDGFGAAFDRVSDGLRAAAGLAAALAAEEWEGPALRCRIGVHAGEAEPTGSDYFGPTVTRAARIMDAGNGGQILVSEAARRLLGDAELAAMPLVDVGVHRLKDLGDPTRIYRLMSAGADDPRMLRSLDTSPNNLPTQLSSFVGRQAHIKEVCELVRQSRLVTLTGVGGVGKTRLSLQVAAELLDEFDDGVWFVELAPLAEADFLAETVATALGVPPDPTTTPEQRLMRFLPSKKALLVMDNCEHLIDEVADLVVRLLAVSPDVQILATSREGLAVAGELLWRVPSLRVDDDAAAVELFAERARLVKPNFKIDDDNIEVVAELCLRLDGIPLAIELATARLKMLSLEQISELLNDRFRLLTGGGRTAVERQRTLKAMMDWSYDLLSERDQALLRTLSVFYDGFTYEAAEDVCSGEILGRYEILDLLGHLVEASLVTFESEGRPRYGLLETVRQYALDKLVESGEADAARIRHAEHFRRTSEMLSHELNRGKLDMVDVGTEDLANYRAAMTWSMEAGHSRLGLELAVALRPFFWERSDFREAMTWLTKALDGVDDDTLSLVAVATAYGLTDATNVGGDAPIQAMVDRARRVLPLVDDDVSKGILVNSLGSYEMAIDARHADELYAEAIALMRSSGDPRWISPLQNRFLLAWAMNAREAEEEILALIDEAEGLLSPNRQHVGRVLFKVLTEKYSEVLAETDVIDPADGWAKILLLLYRMQAQRAMGQPQAALETVERFTAQPAAIIDGWRGWQKAMAHMQLGDMETAIENFSAPGAYNRDLPTADDRANVAWFWSLVAERRGEYEPAAVLLGFAGALSERAAISLRAFDLELVEESRKVTRDALGESIFAGLIETGASTPWEDLPLVHR